MTVNNSTIANNHQGGPPPNGAGGGGIFNWATATINNSTIANNFAESSVGGGIFNEEPGMLTLTNSTITGNDVTPFPFYGGGTSAIENDFAVMVITNCTISGNGHYFDQNLFAVTDGIVNLRNSILAGNRGGGFEFNDVNSSGYNVLGFGSAYFIAPTDIVYVDDPLLGPLQNNGGPTQTMALLAGSPALTAGDPAQLGVPDQRGVVRSGGVNIGAYQASASAFVLTAPPTVMSGMPFDVTVTAVDPFGQVALGYTGTATFSTSDPDPGVVLPADYTFTASDQGTHTFSSGFTLITPGDQTLTATDTSDTTIVGSATVTVTSGGSGGSPNGSPPPRHDTHLGWSCSTWNDAGLDTAWSPQFGISR